MDETYEKSCDHLLRKTKSFLKCFPISNGYYTKNRRFKILIINIVQYAPAGLFVARYQKPLCVQYSFSSTYTHNTIIHRVLHARC